MGCYLVEGLLRADEEGTFFEEVGGGISADGEFRKHYEVCAESIGAGGEVEDEAGVSGEVADGGVDLGERNLHFISLLPAKDQPETTRQNREQARAKYRDSELRSV